MLSVIGSCEGSIRRSVVGVENLALNPIALPMVPRFELLTGKVGGNVLSC